MTVTKIPSGKPWYTYGHGPLIFLFHSTLFSADLEAILVTISLVLCDFKSLQFEVVAVPICDLGISGQMKWRASMLCQSGKRKAHYFVWSGCPWDKPRFVPGTSPACPGQTQVVSFFWRNSGCPVRPCDKLGSKGGRKSLCVKSFVCLYRSLVNWKTERQTSRLSFSDSCSVLSSLGCFFLDQLAKPSPSCRILVFSISLPLAAHPSGSLTSPLPLEARRMWGQETMTMATGVMQRWGAPQLTLGIAIMKNSSLGEHSSPVRKLFPVKFSVSKLTHNEGVNTVAAPFALGVWSAGMSLPSNLGK